MTRLGQKRPVKRLQQRSQCNKWKPWNLWNDSNWHNQSTVKHRNDKHGTAARTSSEGHAAFVGLFAGLCVCVCSLPCCANNNPKRTNVFAPATQIIVVCLCVPDCLALFWSYPRWVCIAFCKDDSSNRWMKTGKWPVLFACLKSQSFRWFFAECLSWARALLQGFVLRHKLRRRMLETC